MTLTLLGWTFIKQRENRWERKSKQSRQTVHRTDSMGRKVRTSSLIHAGWKARKYPAMAEAFFLTFTFIVLIRSWSLI